MITFIAAVVATVARTAVVHGRLTRTDLAALLIGHTTETMGPRFAAWVFADGSPFWTLLPSDVSPDRSLAYLASVEDAAARLIRVMPADVYAATLAYYRRRCREEGDDASPC